MEEYGTEENSLDDRSCTDGSSIMRIGSVFHTDR